MTSPSLTFATTGSFIDGNLYTWFSRQAQSAPHWFDALISGYASFGLCVFALMMIWCWWRARQARNATSMAMTLALPVAVVAANVVNDIIKSIVTEIRPCRALPATLTLLPCPEVGDWSFPSTHSAIAAAVAAAIWLISRRLGIIATLLALVMGFSRVWVGAHYPHDVMAGFMLGVAVAVPVELMAKRYAPSLVVRLQSGLLRILLTAG